MATFGLLARRNSKLLRSLRGCPLLFSSSLASSTSSTVSSSFHSSSASRSPHIVFSFSSWKKLARDWAEQVVAGPGEIARQEEQVFNFDDPARSLRGWGIVTDKGIGGQSTATVDIIENKFVRFQGQLIPPVDLPVDKSTSPSSSSSSTSTSEEGERDCKEEEEAPGKKVEERKENTGTAFSVLQTEKGMLQTYDFEPFQGLKLKTRGDGRKYIISLKTENWVLPSSQSDDMYQGYIQPKEGEWQEIILPFDKFLLTWKGKVLNEQSIMNRRNVISLSVATVADKEESFSLDIQWIKACNFD